MFTEIANLHKLCFPNKPWSASDFADLKKSGCEIIVSQNSFVVYRCVADEAEIITIGVAPNARRNGIGSTLLTIIEKNIKNQGVNKIFLEVALNNIAGKKLYENNGYKVVGIRPKYYDGIDAVLMAKDL